ncbi:MAG: penicillin-binding transpeptidase domain-containing protein [Bacteriovoracaceae bacterium]|jgi:cell division protein FtsI (penicillin-binding protein 3)|nr:penicillin-binding transpeptidase domain-containing protein [Bacteriovoracaceae bacterium]
MKIKITFAFLFIAVLFTSVVVKAFYIQVINRNKLITYSNSQVIRTKKIYPKRGQILDRNMNPLAVNIKRYNIFTYGKKTQATLESLKKLSYKLDKLPYEKIIKNIKARKNKFTWISRHIDLNKEQYSFVKKLKGIEVETQFSRMYPNHELASQLVGFVGIDNEGLSGIENYFNKELKGKPQVTKYYRDAKGRPVKFESDLIPTPSSDIVLSIDKNYQAILENYLKEGVLKHEAIRGGAAIMDAHSGEILAIANYPTYDPNNYSSYKGRNRKLSFVTDPFEPGSVFKSLTIASGINRNIIKEDTNYFCERGKFKVQNHYIKESDSKSNHEWLTVKDILKYSSNIGTTKIAFDITYPKLKEDLDKFNIGKKTGIQLKGESRGILEQKPNIDPLRLSNISFGQGVATTGIQMLASYAPFVNGGYYIKPTFLKKNNPSNKVRVVSAKTAKKVKDMLVEAVEDGTGKNAKVKYFTIGGKTSTAQRIDDTGKYNGYISGFIGFPVGIGKDFITFVYIDNPKKGYYGNTVAAPIFKKIVSSILYKNKAFNKLAKTEPSKKTDIVRMKRSGIRRFKKGLMPNLIGLDKTTVFELLDKEDIQYNTKGFGVIVKQFPAPGQKLSKNTIVDIEFAAPDYE